MISNYFLEPVTLDYGIGKFVDLQMTLILQDDIDPRDMDGINLTALKLYVIDAFGNRHAIAVAPSTMLFLDTESQV